MAEHLTRNEKVVSSILTTSSKKALPKCFGSAFLLSLCGKLLSYFLDLILRSLLGRVPAVTAHLFVNAVLHTKGVIQRSTECLVNIGGRGLNSTVHIQIAYTLRGEEKVFHNISVVHAFTSLNKTEKLRVQLLIAVYILLDLLLECGIRELADRVIALSHEKLRVTECVLDIE